MVEDKLGDVVVHARRKVVAGLSMLHCLQTRRSTLSGIVNTARGV